MSLERVAVVIRHNTQLEGDFTLAKREIECLLKARGKELISSVELFGFLGDISAATATITATGPFVAIGFERVKVEALRQLVRRSAFAQEVFFQDEDSSIIPAGIEVLGAASCLLPCFGTPSGLALGYNYIIESESALDSTSVEGRIKATIALLLEPYLQTKASAQSRRLRSAKKTTLSLSHDLHIYKAKFFPRMVRALLNIFGKDQAFVLDPYCGSGTALLEASLLEIPNAGCDIDPISELISKTKVLPFLDPVGLNKTLDRFVAALKSSPKAGDFAFPAELAAKLARRDKIDGTAYFAEVQREAACLAAALRQLPRSDIHAELVAVLASDALTKKVRYRFVGVGNGAYTIEIVKQPLLERLTEKINRCRQLAGVFVELRTLLDLSLGVSEARAGDARDGSTWPSVAKPTIVLTSPPYLPASSGREHYAASRALSFAVLGYGAGRLGYHDVVNAQITSEFQADQYPEALSLMNYLESDASDSADPQRDAMRFERKAVPTKHYLGDVRSFFRSSVEMMSGQGTVLMVVAHHHVFYSHRRQELEHVVSGRDLYSQIASREGLELSEEIELKLMKSAASRARPRAKDDYAESVLVMSPAGARSVSALAVGSRQAKRKATVRAGLKLHGV